MENLTNVLAAFDAGKLPSQTQLEQFIDFVKLHVLAQVKEATGGSSLSPQGETLAKHVGAVLDAYKTLGVNKNGDDIVQEALWHLSQGDVATSSPDISMDTDEAADDFKAVQKSLRNLVQIVWSSISSESSELFSDFSSFARLALADTAEAIEGQASRAKSSLRDVEEGVQEGQRDTLGRDKQRLEEEQDVKVSFEHGMDTLKGAGVSVIATSQEATTKVEDMADNTSSRFQDAFTKICERAQNDKAYHDSISTMLNIIEKWLTRSEDAINSASVDTPLIYDPTSEQHVTKALKGLQTFVERLAGNKSLDDIFTKGRVCAIHIQKDRNLQTWFHDFFKIIRRTLDESGYSSSDDFKRTRKDLRVRWKKFFDDDATWKRDWAALKVEVTTFEEALANDKDLQRLRTAHAQMGVAIQQGLTHGVDSAKSGLEAAMDQASWFWRDIFQTYVPRMLSVMKDVPIPRTEYIDDDMELVLENLDISSFNVNPAHVFIRNITDIDVQTSEGSAPAKTAMGAFTHIRVQAVQLALDQVSFFYKDKGATIGPSDFSGLVTFTLPPQGIDINLKLRLIPANRMTQLRRGAGGAAYDVNERELQRGFHVVEVAEVEISNDIDLSITESNHSMLLSVFKPIFTLRFREALERSLSQQIRAGIEWADGIAYDVSKRSQVFRDTGLGNGGAFTAAIWSELGKMQRLSGGGWEATGTGTGVVVEGEKGQSFAIGAEPQILSGDKHGPKATASVSLAERLGGEDSGPAVQEGVEHAEDAGEQVKQVTTDVAKQVKGAVQQGKNELQSFRETVKAKAEREKAQDGWRSTAFDL